VNFKHYCLVKHQIEISLKVVGFNEVVCIKETNDSVMLGYRVNVPGIKDVAFFSVYYISSHIRKQKRKGKKPSFIR
jgi:UDP-N-acetylglucosamine transferase subunit ALG13